MRSIVVALACAAFLAVPGSASAVLSPAGSNDASCKLTAAHPAFRPSRV